jgi:hypothetical protein
MIRLSRRSLYRCWIRQRVSRRGLLHGLLHLDPERLTNRRDQHLFHASFSQLLSVLRNPCTGIPAKMGFILEHRRSSIRARNRGASCRLT